MQTVNIHAAETQFSRLVVAVEAGVGKPVARLVPIAAPVPLKRRLGTLISGTMFADEITELFDGRGCSIEDESQSA